MKLLKGMIGALLLCGGVILVSYVVATPDTQPWQSLLGGFCLGMFAALVVP